jgi:hypothetical protein
MTSAIDKVHDQRKIDGYLGYLNIILTDKNEFNYLLIAL